MAIRTQRLEGGDRAKSRSLEGEVDKLGRLFKKSLSESDPQAFAAALKSVAELGDPHRALQADLGAMRLISASRSKPQVWSQFYLAFASHLLSRLTAAPLEPELWNCLGVCLFELGENRAADKSFAVISRIYPEHQMLRGNRRAVKQRKKAGTPKRPFSASVIFALRELSAQVERLAGGVRLPDPQQQKLSLVMIVRDEEEMLPECLASAKDLVDEIIIVDTGSADRTREIALSAGAQVIDFAWTGSFSEARNVSLEAASGDWLLQLDADERLVPEDAERLRGMLSRVYCEGFTLMETNYTGSGGGGAAVMHAPLRLWRNRPQYRFEGVIHEQKTANMPVYLESRFQATDLRILHFGYTKEMIQGRAKSERNLELLEREAKDNPTPFTYFNLGNEYAQLELPEQAAHYYKLSLGQLEENDELLQVGYIGMLAKGVVRQLRLAGELAESSKWCERMRGLLPMHTDLVVEAGYLALQEAALDQAIELGNKALSMGDAPAEMCGVVGAGSFLPLSLIGEAYERQGEFEQAIEVYRESLERFPAFKTPVGSLARAMLRASLPAEQVAEELYPLAEDQPVTTGLLLAHSFYESQAIDQAEYLYRKALEASPSSFVAQVGLVECSLSRGELEQALELCGEPQGAGAEALMRSKLFCLLCLERYSEALPLLESEFLNPEDRFALAAWCKLGLEGQASKLSSDSALALLAFLPALLKLQALQAAEAVIVLSVLSELPMRDRIELSAEALLAAGYLESAAEAWLEAIDKLGPDPESLFGLSRIALAEGRREEAVALAGDALALDSGFGPAESLLAALQQN